MDGDRRDHASMQRHVLRVNSGAIDIRLRGECRMPVVIAANANRHEHENQNRPNSRGPGRPRVHNFWTKGFYAMVRQWNGN